MALRQILAIVLVALVAAFVPKVNRLTAPSSKLSRQSLKDDNTLSQAKSLQLEAVPGESSMALQAASQADIGGPGEDVFVPDMERRRIMNAILTGAVGVSTLGLAAPYLYFFYPSGAGGAGGGVAAKDALGNDVKASSWLAAHQAGDRSLVQGLKGDATYLVVTQDKTLETYGLNAVCTHLGCVVPWNKAENKFMCPCHGSQYNAEGKVVRGPAPLSLALAHVNVNDDDVSFTSWTETDFRTGEAPWWK
jgi:cytochrome b6-f complex iron-sulfur subunit